MERRYQVIRYFAYSIELLVLFIIQETPGLIPAVFGARPILLIPVAVSIAMFENELPAMFFGLAFGLFLDFGRGGALGFHALMLAVICFAISTMAANLIRTNFLTAMLLATASAGLVFLLQWLFYYVCMGYEYTGYALVRHYLPRFGYTVLIMPVAYYFNRALALQIRPKEE